MSDMTLSQLTPEDTPELIAARAVLAEAEEARDQAEAVLSKHRAELNTQAATVNALRQAVQAGDLDAAITEPTEYRKHQGMAEQVSDLTRVTTARRQAVRSAELRVTLAEAVAGIGGMADDAEQARFAAEVGHAIKLILIPALRQAEASDLNVGRTTDTIKAHRSEWQQWAASERGRGQLNDWASLSLTGSEYSPDGFVYRGQQFHSRAASHLEQAVKRALTNAVADLRAERQQQG
jgi:hypothetical protein